LPGPPPPQVVVPGNCPAFLSTDTWSLDFTGGGNAVAYGTENKNGDPPLPPTNQSEQSFTLAFNGSGIAGNLTINVHMHATTNNNGVTTNQILGATVTCS
jgi:hypothetical protein